MCLSQGTAENALMAKVLRKETMGRQKGSDEKALSESEKKYTVWHQYVTCSCSLHSPAPARNPAADTHGALWIQGNRKEHVDKEYADSAEKITSVVRTALRVSHVMKVWTVPEISVV